MAEYRALDPERDAARMREILVEAAEAVDRLAEPKKWAAMRSIFARMSEDCDPRAALAAYRDALTVWRPESDRDSWTACHGAAGLMLLRLLPLGPDELEEAIAHLEAAGEDDPAHARMLAALYRFRTRGDPAENWQKRLRFLERALDQISPTDDPSGWAGCKNEIGIAAAEEPDGKFSEMLEKRIECHRAALAALGEARDSHWVETCLYLSECYRFRAPGNAAENLRLAEQYARDALAACPADTPAGRDREARALLSLGRVLLGGDDRLDAAGLRRALECFDRAAVLIDPEQYPSTAATLDSFRANVYDRLIRLGERQWLEPLVASSESALRRMDPHTQLRDRRVILQVEGEALLEAGDYSRAIDCLERAEEAATAALAECRTIAGRMERIWEFRNTPALLGYCYLKRERIPEALAALERGKARFWTVEDQTRTQRPLQELVPDGGALLFPNFSASEGAVVVVASRSEVVWLPHFGNSRMLELQRGRIETKELGGWLRAYSFRRSQPEGWRREIDASGGTLHEEVWAPVLAKLESMGVGPGAELVWFPQGGSALFPMHAAWRKDGAARRWLIEEYAIRYAPSAACLSAGAGEPAVEADTLLVSNPAGDLVFSELEGAWVRKSVGPARMRLLHGAAATKAAVLDGLARAGAAHFSTHARFDLERPLGSAILLAAQEQLTLEELLPVLRRHAPQMVVLSACETGMSRVTVTPDESLGFPAAFLHSGTRTVLATLWPVNDAAAAFLVGRFCRELHAGGKSAAQALRSAQNWLRTATVSTLMGLLRELREEPAPAGPLAARLRTGMRGADPQSRPFAEPYYWAAFALSGQG